MQSPRSIVIVKLSAIGDVLHGVPVAVAARRAFPDARIGWVVEGRAADVLAGHPAIDHLFRMPRGWLKSPAEVLALRRQLRAFAAEIAGLSAALMAAAHHGIEPAARDRLRADANGLVVRAAQAALTASKGAGFVVGHPVERLVRESLFFLVWSCPQAVSDAVLCDLAAR